MKIVCLVLVSTLALTSAYSSRPQYYNNMAAANNNQYHQQQQQQYAASASNNNYRASTSSHGSEKDAQILRSDSAMQDDGSFHSEFETSNGIKRADHGGPDGSMQGSSSYISPEGIEIKTTYVADETGYHPVGDHIPKIPDYILRSLEYIRTHPYVEKDYYTGEVKQTSFNGRKATPSHQRSQHNSNNRGNNNNRYNF